MTARGAPREGTGQVLPLVALLIMLAGVLMVGITRVATQATSADHARRAADLVALAGATGGRLAADQVAAANAVELVGYDERPSGVRVEVALGSLHAVAQAALSVPAAVPPALRAVVTRASQVLATPIVARAWGSDGLSLAVDPGIAARLQGREAETGLCAGPLAPWFEICPPGER